RSCMPPRSAAGGWWSAQIALAQILLFSAEAPCSARRSRPLSIAPRNWSPSPRAARCRRASWELRGRLAAALGHTPAADRALREARDLYRTIGATGDGARLGTGIGA